MRWCGLLWAAWLISLPTGYAVPIAVTISLPPIGVGPGGESYYIGGLSGVRVIETARSGTVWRLMAVTDRGPNLDPATRAGRRARPFALPEYVPSLVRLDVDLSAGTAAFVERIPMHNADGRPVSGLPNQAKDEWGVDLRGRALTHDPQGLDIEGLAPDGAGGWWLCEEYRPSLARVDARGVVAARYVPDVDGATASGVPALPSAYAGRRDNRGFEGVATLDGKVYAMLQAPLPAPDGDAGKDGPRSRAVRLLVFDPVTATVVGEYVYPLDAPGGKPSGRVGDLAAHDGALYALEHDADARRAPYVRVYRLDLTTATNMLDRATTDATPVEAIPFDALPARGIQPIGKALLGDLTVAARAGGAKPEGLAFAPDGGMVVAFDNDFGLAGRTCDFEAGRLDAPPGRVSHLLVLPREVPP